MKIGLKFRCYPDSNLKQLIHQTAGNNRFIYNHFLQLKSSLFQSSKQSISYNSCSSLLTSLKHSTFSFVNPSSPSSSIDFMTISGSDFDALHKSFFLNLGWATSSQFALRSLDDAFSRFFKKISRYPQFKKKSFSDSITITPNNWKFIHIVTGNRLADLGSNSKTNTNIINTNIDNCGLSPDIHDYLLYLSGHDKPLKIKLDGRCFNPAKISKITLSFNASGHYYITFLADEELSSIKASNLNQINQFYLAQCDVETGEKHTVSTAIDVGIKNTLNIRIKNNASNEYKEKKLKGLERHNKLLRRAQQNLSRKQKKSKNYNKQRVKVASIHTKMVNIRNDFYHQESTRIVLESDIIYIEDLNIRGMIKNKTQSKAISQQGWGQFNAMLKYKAKWYGKKIVEVDRYYPSSKLCNDCKTYNAHVKRQDKWECVYCGKSHQRDENATENLIDYENYEKVNNRYQYKDKTKIKENHLNKDPSESQAKVKDNSKNKNSNQVILLI